mmetsp:Transcript_50761/g.120648  ORF Transcript_50761/g.120648 Transcript_50761/m.120648 type:complete len:122 (+) Transcript_50761:94-459(+)|eukprot:CAMPEP_0178442354 /NCGR_PEP_ID=MMETSP0689_2-20121128/38099_1 /TAXON_ID=160604 /ORGANISM="Amphidinium massartii, Strain CS-259" /LENGTH=121 /DNA_ID=CAMNT_0020065853 /DNA_START=41 /DNA_END=406 /DNA_ORIENTATION=+
MVKGQAMRKKWKENRKPLNRRASSRVKSVPKASYEQQQQKKAEMDALKQKEAVLREQRKEVRKGKAKHREAKQKRKEENAVKAGQFQVITKTDKIRKWHKSARKQLVRMGPEQIAKLLGKG